MRIACAKCISLMGVTSHDVGSFQSCSVSNIYDQIHEVYVLLQIFKVWEKNLGACLSVHTQKRRRDGIFSSLLGFCLVSLSLEYVPPVASG